MPLHCTTLQYPWFCGSQYLRFQVLDHARPEEIDDYCTTFVEEVSPLHFSQSLGEWKSHSGRVLEAIPLSVRGLCWAGV